MAGRILSVGAARSLHIARRAGAALVSANNGEPVTKIHPSSTTSRANGVDLGRAEGQLPHRAFTTAIIDGGGGGGVGGGNSSSSSGSRSSSSGLQDVVIVAMARTAIGGFQGGLSAFTAPQLGAAAIAGAVARARLPGGGTAVQEVVMGNVLSAGLGQAPARQAALAAGLADTTICTTVNKVCSSGLKAVTLASQAIMLGHQSVIAAGGMESMSHAPYLLPRVIKQRRHGDLALCDSLILDGLWDPRAGCHMGTIADAAAAQLRISRREQDDEAINSYSKAVTAQATGLLASEIVPVPHPHAATTAAAAAATGTAKQGEGAKAGKGGSKAGGGRGGGDACLMHDEECTRFDPEKMRALPPAFSPNGSVTAGNASVLSDGAAALVLTSAAYAHQHGLPVLARVLGFADAEQAPERYPTTVSLAIPKAVQAAGLSLECIDLFEINEAFAVSAPALHAFSSLSPPAHAVPTSCRCRLTHAFPMPFPMLPAAPFRHRLLGLTPDQVNLHGGAVALGHPIGASGARVLMSLLSCLAATGLKRGVAAVCNGGGGATAVVVEREEGFRLEGHGPGHWQQQEMQAKERGTAR
ncbi:unnamed protein product [Closterium sp. NIES-54]